MEKFELICEIAFAPPDIEGDISIEGSEGEHIGYIEKSEIPKLKAWVAGLPEEE